MCLIGVHRGVGLDALTVPVEGEPAVFAECSMQGIEEGAPRHRRRIAAVNRDELVANLHPGHGCQALPMCKPANAILQRGTVNLAAGWLAS